MAFIQQSGILGQINSNAAGGSLTTLYTVPAGTSASLSVTACNRGTQAAAITIVAQVSAGGTQTLLENTIPLAPAGQPGSSYNMRALPLGPGQAILVQNTNAVVDFTALGVTSPSNVTTI
jgi:hypothetical protein